MYVRARVFVVLIRGKNWRFDSLKKEKCKEKVYVKTLTSNLPCSPLSRFRRTQAVTSARTRIKKQFKRAHANKRVTNVVVQSFCVQSSNLLTHYLPRFVRCRSPFMKSPPPPSSCTFASSLSCRVRFVCVLLPLRFF